MGNLGLAIIGVSTFLLYCGVVTVIKAIQEVRRDEIKRRKSYQ